VADIFYVNLVPGALMVGMLYFSLDRQADEPGVIREVDWPGIITMAIGSPTPPPPPPRAGRP